MARKQALQPATTAPDASMERLKVAAASRIGVLLPPWAVLILVMVVAAVSHSKWGAPPAVTWVTLTATLSTTVLTGLTYLVSHHRGTLGRTHSTVTTAGGGLWFTIATITGPAAPFTLAAWFFGGGTIALAWNIRVVIRRNPSEDAAADPLAWLFDRAKESFGLKGAKVRTTDVGEHRIKGKMALPPGEKTADDAIKKTGYIESGMQLPPGTIVLAPDEDDASQTHFTLSDPRTMKRPLPWPGAYRPGGSIAEPLRVGLYQDTTEVLHRFTDSHLQVMGQSGSGKSIGGAWNYLGEIITRRDAAAFVVDLAKDTQTVGPLAEGLHRIITAKPDLAAFIRTLHKIVPQRTKYLAERGYQKWVKDCGLTFVVVWIEEASKVFDELSPRDEELLLQIIKEARSAGCRMVLSLQRSDYTQMPTIARGQLGKMCFGVAEPDDASFGLSERQKNAGAAPELWGEHQPGMAYLDVPGIPETHYAMPLRTFAWGATDTQANAAMRAHAAAYPAAAKALDEFTAALTTTEHPANAPAGIPQDPPADDVPATDLPHDWDYTMNTTLNPTTAYSDMEGAGEDYDIGDPIADYQTDTDPADIPDISPGDPITAPSGSEDRFEIPAPGNPKMSPHAARGLVHDWIRHRARTGRPTFTASDPELIKIKDATGMRSRGWTYKILAELVNRDVLMEDDSKPTKTYSVIDPAALDDPPQAA